MPKVNRSGQSSIWTEFDLRRFLSQISNPKHWLFCQFLIFTGERVGAICRLRVTDCYEKLSPIKARQEMVFPGRIRKRSRTGESVSREVPIHSVLQQSLEEYLPDKSEWLFPSPRVPQSPVTPSSVDHWFRCAAQKAGVLSRGYSLHSFRRTFITDLHEKGVDIAVIQKITGHKSLESLRKYIDVSPERVKNAIDLL